MKLSQLLSILGADCPDGADITALTCDSRKAAPGALFAALPGCRADGRAYIPEAGLGNVRPAVGAAAGEGGEERAGSGLS